MHWNVSRLNSGYNRYARGISLAFLLFGSTPASSGVGVRDRYTERYELVGDHIPCREQLAATALLIGSYSAAIEQDTVAPLMLPGHLGIPSQSPTISMRVLGLNPSVPVRDQSVEIRLRDEHVRMDVQEYLERFYTWIEPMARELGTREEVANLEGFVMGVSQLEFDRTEHYRKVRTLGLNDYGAYLPDERTGMVLKRQPLPPIPREGRLWGALVKHYNRDIRIHDWDSVCHNAPDGEYNEYHDLNMIYEFAQGLHHRLPSYARPRECLSMPAKHRAVEGRVDAARTADASQDAALVFA